MTLSHTFPPKAPPRCRHPPSRSPQCWSVGRAHTSNTLAAAFPTHRFPGLSSVSCWGLFSDLPSLAPDSPTTALRLRSLLLHPLSKPVRVMRGWGRTERGWTREGKEGEGGEGRREGGMRGWGRKEREGDERRREREGRREEGGDERSRLVCTVLGCHSSLFTIRDITV